LVSVDLGSVNGNLASAVIFEKKADLGGEAFMDSPQKSFSGPVMIRMVVFLPGSYSEPPRPDIPGFSCQGTFFLSQDDGTSWIRIADTRWSAPNFSPSHITLPVPIFVPSGVTITTKVRLWMGDGPDVAGCRLRAMLWANTVD
jgi:hypothetical protein